ncbi:MAG TPA: glycosyltransferase family 4 protein [Candidatus Binataceae bacterium]|nr:glycosyltransferase family 4 protein [Candidatus Binataceae bacterium]
MSIGTDTRRQSLAPTAASKRILFVSLTPPVPPTNGHRMRNLVLLRALAAEGHRVSLVSFADPDGAEYVTRRLGELCHDVTLVAPEPAGHGRGGQYWPRLCALSSPFPYGVWRFASRALAGVVSARLARGGVDVVICDGIYLVRNLPRPARVPIILSEQAISHEALARYLRYESNPLKLAYGWIEYRKTRRWELRACAGVSGVIACSSRERHLLGEMCPDARVAVVPNCVDTESYLPVEDDDGATVLFVGAMDWLPNRDAIDFLCARILPPLRAFAPGATLIVAGRNPSSRLGRRLAAIPGLRFVGAVEDTRPLLARAAAFVAPLRIGSGTRIKILEAAAMAKPIVSTTLGAEGLELSNGKEILLADEPRRFARAVADLLSDPGRRRAMGRAARRRVTEQYSLPALRHALCGALVELC